MRRLAEQIWRPRHVDHHARRPVLVGQWLNPGGKSWNGLAGTSIAGIQISSWMLVLGAAIVILLIYTFMQEVQSKLSRPGSKPATACRVGKNIQRAELLRRLFRSGGAGQGVGVKIRRRLTHINAALMVAWSADPDFSMARTCRGVCHGTAWRRQRSTVATAKRLARLNG